MKKILIFFVITILTGIILNSCEESLPSRNETPIDLFSTFLTTVDGRTSFSATSDPDVPGPPPVRIRFGVINIFDETFQGTADNITGSVDIWITNDVDLPGKTYLLTANSEVPPIGVPPLIENNILTIDPGDTFYVEISWPHVVEDTISVYEFLGMPDGSTREVIIGVIAKIQLFSEQPILISELLQLHILYIKNG